MLGSTCLTVHPETCVSRIPPSLKQRHVFGGVGGWPSGAVARFFSSFIKLSVLLLISWNFLQYATTKKRRNPALYTYAQPNELIKNTFSMMCAQFECRTCSDVCFSSLSFFPPPAPPPRLVNLLHIGKDILKLCIFTSLFLLLRIPHHPKRSQSSLAWIIHACGKKNKTKKNQKRSRRCRFGCWTCITGEAD